MANDFMPSQIDPFSILASIIAFNRKAYGLPASFGVHSKGSGQSGLPTGGTVMPSNKGDNISWPNPGEDKNAGAPAYQAPRRRGSGGGDSGGGGSRRGGGGGRRGGGNRQRDNSDQSDQQVTGKFVSPPGKDSEFSPQDPQLGINYDPVAESQKDIPDDSGVRNDAPDTTPDDYTNADQADSYQVADNAFMPADNEDESSVDFQTGGGVPRGPAPQEEEGDDYDSEQEPQQSAPPEPQPGPEQPQPQQSAPPESQPGSESPVPQQGSPPGGGLMPQGGSEDSFLSPQSIRATGVGNLVDYIKGKYADLTGAKAQAKETQANNPNAGPEQVIADAAQKDGPQVASGITDTYKQRFRELKGLAGAALSNGDNIGAAKAATAAYDAVPDGQKLDVQALRDGSFGVRVTNLRDKNSNPSEYQLSKEQLNDFLHGKLGQWDHIIDTKDGKLVSYIDRNLGALSQSQGRPIQAPPLQPGQKPGQQGSGQQPYRFVQTSPGRWEKQALPDPNSPEAKAQRAAQLFGGNARMQAANAGQIYRQGQRQNAQPAQSRTFNRYTPEGAKIDQDRLERTEQAKNDRIIAAAALKKDDADRTAEEKQAIINISRARQQQGAQPGAGAPQQGAQPQQPGQSTAPQIAPGTTRKVGNVNYTFDGRGWKAQ